MCMFTSIPSVLWTFHEQTTPACASATGLQGDCKTDYIATMSPSSSSSPFTMPRSSRRCFNCNALHCFNSQNLAEAVLVSTKVDFFLGTFRPLSMHLVVRNLQPSLLFFQPSFENCYLWCEDSEFLQLSIDDVWTCKQVGGWVEVELSSHSLCPWELQVQQDQACFNTRNTDKLFFLLLVDICSQKVVLSQTRLIAGPHDPVFRQRKLSPSRQSLERRIFALQ